VVTEVVTVVVVVADWQKIFQTNEHQFIVWANKLGLTTLATVRVAMLEKFSNISSWLLYSQIFGWELEMEGSSRGSRDHYHVNKSNSNAKPRLTFEMFLNYRVMCREKKGSTWCRARFDVLDGCFYRNMFQE
jgi:hypothetical protein